KAAANPCSAVRRHSRWQLWRPSRRSCGILSPESADAALPRTISLLSGIGALLRRPHPERIVKEGGYPGNNRYVGKVKDIPAELPAPGSNVKKHEIHAPSQMQPADGVADGPTDDQTERDGRKPRRYARKPRPEEDHHHRLEHQQSPGAQKLALLEKPV